MTRTTLIALLAHVTASLAKWDHIEDDAPLRQHREWLMNKMEDAR